MAEATPSFNDPKLYGVEIDTPVIQQEVNGRTQSYKTFIKDGKVTILPVDYTGAVEPNAYKNAIYEDGVWYNNRITQPGTNQVGKGSYSQVVTIDGLERVDNGDGTFSYVGKMNNDIKFAVNNHSVATGQPTPEFAKVENDNYANGIPAEIARLKEEIKGANGNDKRAKENKLSRLQEQWNRSESNEKVESDGLFGMPTRGASDYDTDSDIMFATPVKYPMDMSLYQDHFSIQCYAYQAPYATAFKGKNIGAAFGAQRGTPFRKKLGAGIYLPMPNNMIDGNARNWEEDNMSLQGLEAIRNSMSNGVMKTVFRSFGAGNAISFISNAESTVRSATQRSGRQEIVANKLSQLVGDLGYDISADAILGRSLGVIANSNTELLFAGVSMRSFEFSWVLSPRDRREAANVRMIIRALKQWSAPRKLSKLASGKDAAEKGRGTGLAGGPSYFLSTPNVFRLRYLTNGNNNILGVNKFKPCALTDINMNYTPEGMWMAYENGMPVSVQMSLKFNELEPIYNTDYSDKIQDGRNFAKEPLGDLMPIGIVRQDTPYTTDVGY